MSEMRAREQLPLLAGGARELTGAHQPALGRHVLLNHSRVTVTVPHINHQHQQEQPGPEARNR